MKRLSPGLILAAAVLIFSLQAAPLGLCLQDDAYISLRFARHFAEGQGLVYNPGEHVEGYTNFLWTVLCAIPYRLHLDPELFLRVMGWISGIAAALAAGVLAGRIGGDSSPLSWVAAFLVAGLPSLTAEAMMGLETAAFAALGAIAVSRYLLERSDASRTVISGALLASAALTRPEGVLLAGIVAIPELLHRDRTATIRGLSFALPVLAHLLFRRVYYGDWVPNTFHAKVEGGAASVIRGAHELAGLVVLLLPILCLAAVGIAAWARGRTRQPTVQRETWIAVAIPTAFLAYALVIGGDFKPTYRFEALATLFLCAWAGRGVAAIARRYRQGALLAVLLVIASSSWTLWQGSPARRFATERALQIPVHRAAGDWLGKTFQRNDWLATGNAGLIPYQSRLPTIDMYGLCDRHIASRPVPPIGTGIAGHEKGDGEYILERAPRIILFQMARFSESPLTASMVARRLTSVSEKQLWDDPRFHSRYRLRSERLPGFVFNYFLRQEEAQ